MKCKLSVLIGTALLGVVSTSSAYNDMLTATNIAELQSLSVPTLIANGYTNPTVFVRGYYAPGDRGGGNFEWNAGSTGTPDGGRFITTNGWTSGAGRWVRQLNGETANVKMWGAKGDWYQWLDYAGTSAHDDTTNIQNAFNACVGILDYPSQNQWTAELLFPPGWYKVTDTLVWAPGGLKLRGELSPELVMPYNVQKDILRGVSANDWINGTVGQQSDLNVRIEGLVFRVKGWETNRISNPTNCCLVIANPQEGNSIHNVTTIGGACGIRCFGGGNGAPFALRDVDTHNATFAGVSIEPVPGAQYCSGHVSILGITGDYFNEDPPTKSSLVRFVRYFGDAQIEDLNAEGTYSAGVIRHEDIRVAAGLTSGGSEGTLTIGNCQYNGSTGFDYNTFLVLTGEQRTATVTFKNPTHIIAPTLLRDDITGRSIPTDYMGTMQIAPRLPFTYEGSDDFNTNNILGKRSRFVMGNTAIYSFTPTNTGWYRIMAPMNGGGDLISGKLTIRSCYRDGAELEANVNSVGGSGNILLNVLRSIKNSTGGGYPLVTKARGFYYYDNTWGGGRSGLDVYVANLVTNFTYDWEKRITFTLPLDGVNDAYSGIQQLLMPVSAVSTGSGDTDGLPSGATYSVVSVVR